MGVFGEDGLTDRLVAALLISAVCLVVGGAVLGLALSEIGISGLEDEEEAVVLGETGVDPSTLETERNLTDFERRLAQRLQRQVEQGAVNLSEGEFAAVREQVNSSQYRNLLESYESVASETGNRQRARNLTRLQRSLANYSRLAQRYEQGYAEYHRERASTDDDDDVQEIRQIARDLERIYETATAAGNRTLDRFEALDRRTRLNVSTSASAIRISMANITQNQQGVRDASFVETRLSVTADGERVGFDDPLSLSGRLELVNGTGLANESIELRIADHPARVTTNATGGFALTYRPVELPVGTSNITVQFVPDVATPYLGAERTLPVDVSQVEPTVTTDLSPPTGGYNDTLTVSGRVAVGDVGVAGVPVIVTLEDGPIVDATTDASGVYAANVTVPADVPPGDRGVDVRLPLVGQALAGTDASTAVAVRERDTRLSVSARRLEGRLLRVTGRLRIETGTGVPGRSVALAAGGGTLTTVTTGPGGRFNTTVVVPRSAASGEVSLAARFGATGLNLAPANATASVTMPTGGTPAWLVAVALVAVLGIGGAVVLVVRRRRQPDADPDPAGVDGDGPADEETTVRADPDAILSLARSRLDADDSDGAVRAAYAAVRVAMNGTGGDTHWEFYRARAADGLDPATVDALRDLTTAYERATYAAESVAESDGRRAVEAAASITASAS